MKNIFKALALSATLLLGVTSCTGDFDEINTNPNAYSSVPNTNILANILRYSAGQWTCLDIEQWAGHVAAIQYLNAYQDYIPTNNTYGNRWYLAYYAYTQMNAILENTEDNAEGNKNMRNVAKLWQVYMMYLNTTCFGKMPFTEAFQGPEILEPVYDSEETIYTSLLATLKEIGDSWASGFGSDALGDGDFMYDGDIAKWQKFCNSLRVKMAMQISNVYSQSKSIVEEVINNPSRYPMITENDESLMFWWQGTSPYYEPWYDNYRTRDDDGMAQIFIDHLKKMNDPRLAVYAIPATKDGEYRGAENGALGNFADISVFSRIGAKFRKDPKGFTPFYRANETYFLIAEAALKGWTTPMSAEEAYIKGVELNMEENEVDEADVEAYLNGPGKFDGSLEMLYNEMWVSYFKQGISSWTMYRRTGYPLYIQTAKAADGVTQQYPGARAAQWGSHNDVPFRFPYPQNQYSYNTANVEAAAAGFVDHVWGEQMWWDTRTGVH